MYNWYDSILAIGNLRKDSTSQYNLLFAYETIGLSEAFLHKTFVHFLKLDIHDYTHLVFEIYRI